MINSAAWAIPNVALLSEEKNKYIGCEWWLARESWNVCSAPEFCELNSFPKPLCSLSPDVPEEDANEHILILQNHQILSKEPNRMSSSPANLFSDGEGLYCYKSSNQRGHNKKDAVFFFRNNRHFLIILMNIIIYFLIILEAAVQDWGSCRVQFWQSPLVSCKQPLSHCILTWPLFSLCTQGKIETGKQGYRGRERRGGMRAGRKRGRERKRGGGVENRPLLFMPLILLDFGPTLVASFNFNYLLEAPVSKYSYAGGLGLSMYTQFSPKQYILKFTVGAVHFDGFWQAHISYPSYYTE